MLTHKRMKRVLLVLVLGVCFAAGLGVTAWAVGETTGTVTAAATAVACKAGKCTTATGTAVKTYTIPTVTVTTGATAPPPPPPPPPPPAGEPAPIAGQGYHEVWRDDFDALGSTDWGQGIWYNPGAPANSIFVANGVLNLVSRRSQGYPDITVTTEAGSNPHIFQYGYFEARMRWTGGAGAWPAFWLYSYQHAIDNDQCATQAGEIDVMEGQGTEPNVLYGTVHSNTNNCAPADQQNGNNYQPQASRLADNWHTYSAVWTPTTVTWYLDGAQVMSAPTYASDNQTMFILLQMWIGGWTSGTTASTPDELKTEVDYVTAWQK